MKCMKVMSFYCATLMKILAEKISLSENICRIFAVLEPFKCMYLL